MTSCEVQESKRKARLVSNCLHSEKIVLKFRLFALNGRENEGYTNRIQGEGVTRLNESKYSHATLQSNGRVT